MSDIIEAAARALYLSWFPDAPVEEHFQWYHDGAANPDSCVHSSNVAKALKDAATATPLIRAAALEEAAKMMEGMAEYGAGSLAAAIRALKEQP
jgi:hypothetical protein